jgi:uncharacterized protein (TIGR03437 family)
LLSVISVDINAPYPGGPDIGFVELAFVLDLSLVQHGLPAPSCLVNGATFYSAPATAGTISTLFGSNLGPSTGVSYQLGADGLIPNVLGGTSLTVGGVQAPLLYAQDTQINFVVPQQLSGNTTNICITRSGAQSCMVAFTAPEWPVIFCVSAPCTSYSTGFAILNQDGTLNTPSNPASLNSVIQIFGTGMGPYDRTLMDGSIVGPPLAHLTSQVQATFYGAVTCQVEISISTFPKLHAGTHVSRNRSFRRRSSDAVGWYRSDQCTNSTLGGPFDDGASDIADWHPLNPGYSRDQIVWLYFPSFCIIRGRALSVFVVTEDGPGDRNGGHGSQQMEGPKELWRILRVIWPLNRSQRAVQCCR